MKRNIKLSIIIVNYYTEKYIRECLKSIYAVDFPKREFEVIIVDNGSGLQSLKSTDNITLIKNKNNLGFAKANNIGVSASSGRYILFLNPDTILKKNALSRMVSFMDNHSYISAATCRVTLPNGVLDDACHRGFPTPWNAFCYFSGLGGIFTKSSFFNGYHLGYRDLNKIHEIDACCGAFMMVRREDGERIKWFDEDYFWYGEDLDFCYRLKISGRRIFFVPDVKITHYKGISSGIKNHSKELSVASNQTKILATRARFDVMKTFYKKHYMSKYPKIITSLVLLAISIKRFINLFRFKNADRN